MEIWDIIESRQSDDSDYDELEEEEEALEPVTLEILINALINTKLYKKFKPTLPTPNEALKDLHRILNAQKFRSWTLRSRS